MINFSTIANKIFKVLKGHGYNVKLYTNEGVETVDPEEARWFFVQEPNMMVVLDDVNEEIKVNKNSTLSYDVFESSLKQIKSIATHYILNFTIRNFAKNVEPKQFSWQAKKRKKEEQKMNELVSESTSYKVISHGKIDMASTPEEALKLASRYIAVRDGQRHLDDLKNGKTTMIGYGFNEVHIEPIMESSFSKMKGSSKTSVQALEGVKVIVKHGKPVNEEIRGSRSRNIKEIFIENQGVRTQFPHNNLIGARAMARHLQNGGSFDDVLGEHIIKVTGDLVKLNEFYRYTKNNNLINESTTEVVGLIRENIGQFISELKSFSGSKTYFYAKEAFQSKEQVISEGGDVSSLKDMFTIKQFNEKFEEIMPLLDGMVTMNRNKMVRIQEAASKPILCFRAPLAEDGVIEYTSKSAKIGNKLVDLSKLMVENAELAEFVVKVGKKLISEQKLTDFENKVVTEVVRNVYVAEKKSKKCKKNVTESIMERIELKLTAFEYPTLMESALSGNIKEGQDGDDEGYILANFDVNEPMHVTVYCGETDEIILTTEVSNFYKARELKDEYEKVASDKGMEDCHVEIELTVGAWRDGDGDGNIKESSLNRYQNMSKEEWQTEYNRLEALYKRLEDEGKYDAAERVGDKLSDMELHCPDRECEIGEDMRLYEFDGSEGEVGDNYLDAAKAEAREIGAMLKQVKQLLSTLGESTINEWRYKGSSTPIAIAGFRQQKEDEYKEAVYWLYQAMSAMSKKTPDGKESELFFKIKSAMDRLRGNPEALNAMRKKHQSLVMTYLNKSKAKVARLERGLRNLERD